MFWVTGFPIIHMSVGLQYCNDLRHRTELNDNHLMCFGYE